MKVFWTDPAISDLEAIQDYIARDSELYASDFIASILDEVERLESFPEIGRTTPEANSSKVRELLYGNYRIIYRIHQETVQILTVIHGSRDVSRLPYKPWEV